MCSVTASAAAEDDPQSQALWRSVRAKVLARRRDREKALELAQSAVEQLRATDALVWQADALVDLAETRLLLDDIVGAREAVGEATRLYELKGSEVAAERARALVAAHDVVPQGR
jgi:hypothetical protein